MTVFHRNLLAPGIAMLALAACQETPHTAQWYMAHAAELEAKLAECKKYPTLDQSDPNCRSAGDAFATLIAASAARPGAEAKP